jgi:hypothetical protein
LKRFLVGSYLPPNPAACMEFFEASLVDEMRPACAA